MERSVLIKGMEMPKDGVYWCEIGVAGEIAMITIHGEDRKSFRLIPIPPHGRLIDADKIRYHSGTWEKGFDWVMQSEIALMPTVIPADKDGET